MTTPSGHPLRLSLDLTRTRVVLRTDPECMSDLTRLIGKFGGGRPSGPGSAEIELDTLLASLADLASWPNPENVTWDQDLKGLVISVLHDSEAVEQELEILPADQDVAVGDVQELLGANWIANLTDFQHRDIARLISLNHGANFSVPGAGKTRVALAIYAAMRQRGEAYRILVVCPKSAYESWHFESKACFREPLQAQVLEQSPTPGTELLIVNYERLDKALAILAGWLEAAPAMIVLDEAHRMKLGSNGTYGSACLALGPLCRRRLILTGTPAPNGAKDLENLLGFVWPGHGKRAVANAVAGGDLAHASSVLRPLFTRTTKLELGLPPYETKIRYVELPPLHREIYDALVGRFSARAEASRDNFDALGKAMLRLLMAATSPALLAEGTTRYEPLAYQVPPLEIPHEESLYTLLRNLPSYELSPKYKETLSIVAGNAALGRKTLVWTTFVRSLATLEQLLGSYNPATVHGGTTDRDEQLRRFRENPDCHVLLSNPATLGEGISLHEVCHDAIYVDRDFTAGRFLQSLDRIHRLGLAPETETRVTVLATTGTIDEIVAQRLEQKLEFMGRILDDPAIQQLADLEEEPSIAGGMDMADIRALLGHLDGSARSVA